MLSFTEETQTALPSLLPLFFRNLEDCIASVRQGAACALSSVVRAFGRDALNPVSECINQGLTNIRNQPAATQVSVDHDSKLFGSTYARQAIGNDIGSHSEQQVIFTHFLFWDYHIFKRVHVIIHLENHSLIITLILSGC